MADAKVFPVMIGVFSLGVLLAIGFVYYQTPELLPQLLTGNPHTYVLPELPYGYNALEPYIDEETMKIHHTKHHQAYVNNLNRALKEYPDLQKKTLNQLLEDLDTVPENIRTLVRNNGGGHANHSFFWKVMTPKSTKEPVGKIKELINKTFGSFDEFKNQFNKAALSVFGSGWAWLVLNKDGALEIIATHNQDSPVSQGLVLLLGLDVWEHAYYLKYQNKRADYSDAWWNVVHWEQVEKNYTDTLPLGNEKD